MKFGSIRTSGYGFTQGGVIGCLKLLVFNLLFTMTIIPIWVEVVENYSQMQLVEKARMQAQIDEKHHTKMEHHYQQMAEMDALVETAIEAENIERYEAKEAEKPASSIMDSGAIQVSEAERQHLVQLVFAESGMEVYSDKLSVAKVVLKRATLSGDTVDDVIWAPGQFEPAKENGTITDGDGNDLAQKELPKDCYLAVAQAIDECSTGDFGPFTSFYGNGAGNGNTFY